MAEFCLYMFLLAGLCLCFPSVIVGAGVVDSGIFSPRGGWRSRGRLCSRRGCVDFLARLSGVWDDSGGDSSRHDGSKGGGWGPAPSPRGERGRGGVPLSRFSAALNIRVKVKVL